jgi:hypothetical protein
MLIVQRRRVSVYDPDAQAYITAVEAADTQALEVGVKDAINAFVVGCKADGIWSAIKASCILAGARTLAGALVPLVGTAPTRFGTEGGWSYNRKTGTAGNGTDNYLDSGRAGNADPQDSHHLFAKFAAQTLTPENVSRMVIGSVGNSWISYNTNSGGSGTSQSFYRSRQGASSVATFSTSAPNRLGVNRASSSGITVMSSSATESISVASAAAGTPSYFVFAGNNGSAAIQHTAIRTVFYSIGESLGLALLDARVTALINAIAAAIP